MIPKRYYLTFLWTGVWDICLWFFLIWFNILWGNRLLWNNGLWCEVGSGTWFHKTWAIKFAGAALGHGGLFAPGVPGGPEIDTDTEFHEHIHVEQFEAAMLLSFAIGIVMSVSGSDLVVSAGVWIFGGPMAYCASLCQAWIRGEHPYRGSHLEEAAYSQTKLREKNR